MSVLSQLSAAVFFIYTVGCHHRTYHTTGHMIRYRSQTDRSLHRSLAHDSTERTLDCAFQSAQLTVEVLMSDEK